MIPGRLRPSERPTRARRAGSSGPCLVVRVLGPAVIAVSLTACLPDPLPWVPTEEDVGPDSGPDPGTCEARRDCAPVVK